MAAMLLHRSHDGCDAVQLGDLDLIVLLAGKVAKRKSTLLLAPSVLSEPGSNRIVSNLHLI